MAIKISVITATWNCVGTVADAVSSLSSQTYPTIEHVWIDGASTDGTKEVLARFHKEERGVLISEPDNGIYDALNKGINYATGDVVGFLHADDLYADEEVLSRVASAFTDPDVDAVYGDLVYVRKENPSSVVRYWETNMFAPSRLARGWMPPHPTLYLRRRIFDVLGSFDTTFRIAADYDHILRVFSQPNLKSVYLPHILVKMRVGGASNRSLSNILCKSSEDLRAIRRNKVGGIHTLACKNFSKLRQFWLRRESISGESAY